MSGFFETPITITGSGSAPIGAAGGELSGNYPNPNVITINGASVPDSGSVPVGNILQISSSDTLSYGPLNLSGGSNYITGALPIANQVSQMLTGDLSGTTNAATVIKINGTSIASSPSINQLLVASGSTTSTWSLLNDANISSSAAIVSTKLAYSDISLPALGSTTVQGAIDAIKTTAVATSIQRLSQIISTANLQAAGGVLTSSFNIGSALPTNARVLGAEINVTQALAGTVLNSAIATVQASGEVAGSLIAAFTLLSTGLYGGTGINQYLSRGGQQLNVTITLVGTLFSALSAGALTVNIFYAVIV